MTIAALVVAVVVLSAIALQNLYVPDTANEDAAEATQEITRAPRTTEETTALKGPQATSEEARCSQTLTFNENATGWLITTNDVPGCPKGGLLSGTDKGDQLVGRKGDDEIHGLGARDWINGGLGSDVIYGGAGSDDLIGSIAVSPDSSKDVLYGGDGDDEYIAGGAGEDVLYGGKGNDALEGDETYGPSGLPPMRDELYCGPGKDQYHADKLDYVDSSCEEKVKEGFGGGI